MNQLEFNVIGNKITAAKLPDITSGSVNFDKCKFTFDSQWDNFSKTAVFICGVPNGEYTAAIVGGVCTVPKECLQKSGLLKIGAVGISGDGTVISTNIAVHKITVGANESVQITSFENSDGGELDSSEEMTFEEEISDWADDMYTAKENDIGSLDYDAFKAADENYLTAQFSLLAQKYPDYVKETSAGEDSYGKNIPVFTFTGRDFDRTIFVTANHTRGTYMTSAALGGFFGALCKRNSEDKNLNFLYNKVKFIVLPAAAPTAYENENGLNKNNVNIACNFPFKWDICGNENKGTASASEKETLAVMQALENVSGENIIAVCDFISKNISAEKNIFYAPHKNSDEELLLKTAGKFDCIHSDGGEKNSTVLTPDSSPCFANFAAQNYEASSCSVVWKDDLTLKAVMKYSEFIGNLFLTFAKKCKAKGEVKPEPFTKHIYWRGKSETDVISLTENVSPAYISSFSLEPDSPYNVTMNGYVILKSESGASVTIRPVLYQQNVGDANLSARQNSNEFDISVPILSGVSVIPLNSVIHCTGSCKNFDGDGFPQKLGSFIAASCAEGSAQIIGFSYTLCAVPCGAVTSAEVLTPNGLASDFGDESTTPVFTIKYPIG